MEWLRCEDSSNLFKTPKKVQYCQSRKLKSLIKLVVISQNNLQSIKMFRLPPLPPLYFPSLLGVLKRFDESSHLNHYICSPLRTYNTLNNLTYTLHTPLKHRILHANTLLMPLHTYKVQNFTYLLSSLLACIHA